MGYTYDTSNMDWVTFERLFHKTYFNVNHCRPFSNKFEHLAQRSMTVTVYYNRLMELSQYSQVDGDDVTYLIVKFKAQL